jgi:ElaB/YqjD/DUF883 family membrane-anchored ribosome-binding protein
MSAQTIAPPGPTGDISAHPEPEESLQKGIRSVKTSTLRAAEELKAAAEQTAKDWARAADATAEDLRHKAELALKTTRMRLKSLHDESETYIREHPLKSVLVALGAGFLAGILIRR